MKRHLHSREHGVTLIEVLIAMLVLSIGLLGLAGLYLSALRASQDMHFRVLA
ncbi:MAG: prepilin-type N-terminal cleavage/methylation domain-containing protein, partial [Sphingobacteriia bacterium]|nr:prepilin-type N-terminal cleavage/methylation domain-containing protein [Sphingobacteriia bacterium]